MLYEELQIKLMKLLKPHWSRVISFDIETRIEDPSRFLKNERILSISLARRVSGKLMDEDGIKITTLFLDSDNDECEVGLLKSLDNTLGMIRPLCVIGYGIRQYDIPLLCIKKQHYSLLLWKLIDMCESAVHIDLYSYTQVQRI
jgi:DNA polymerase elongation subunit (family B)